MTITINKTILVYVAVFLATILIGYLYLAQANDIYNAEQTYEMTDHQIQQDNKHETKQVADSNTLVGTIE